MLASILVVSRSQTVNACLFGIDRRRHYILVELGRVVTLTLGLGLRRPRQRNAEKLTFYCHVDHADIYSEKSIAQKSAFQRFEEEF